MSSLRGHVQKVPKKATHLPRANSTGSNAMNLAASAIAVSMLFGGFHPTLGEKAESPSPQPYSVLCRWVDADNSVVVGPRLLLSEGEKGNVVAGSQSPFVIGITTDESGAKKPQIAVIHENTIEVTPVGRQPNGVTVNVVVEQSEITEVEIKETSPARWSKYPTWEPAKSESSTS